MERCYVCEQPVRPDWRGRVLYEGLTRPGSTAWVWGPQAIHGGCRLDLQTGFEEEVEQGSCVRRRERRRPQG